MDILAKHNYFLKNIYLFVFEALNLSSIENLITCIPTAADIEAVNANIGPTGKPENWAPVEMFMFTFKDVFMVKERFDIWLFKLTVSF